MPAPSLPTPEASAVDAARTPVAWLDVSAGVAGDMLLGAFVDAGVPLETVQDGIDRVVHGAVELVAEDVRRAGLRATLVRVELADGSQPARGPSAIARMLDRSSLAEPVRRAAMAVFNRLADAEARVHGVEREQVQFHEVGALDAIADVVGVCTAWHASGIGELLAGPFALGSGTVQTEHGEMPVPVPAVLALLEGTQWPVHAGGTSERATPTGVSLLTTLARPSVAIPAMSVRRVGVGAGTRDTTDHANVVRLVLGEASAAAGTAEGGPAEPRPVAALLLETTVDDLDPRLWPGVLGALLAAGASDAWLTPVLMKKGRPGQVLSVLAPPEAAARCRAVVLRQTSTLGLRQSVVDKYELPRDWVTVSVSGEPVRVKVAHLEGTVLHATPEYADVAAVAERCRRPERDVLAEATAAAVAAGLAHGASLPIAGGSIPLP